MNFVGFSKEFPEFCHLYWSSGVKNWLEQIPWGHFKMVNPTEFTLGIVNTILNDFRFCGKSASGENNFEWHLIRLNCVSVQLSRSLLNSQPGLQKSWHPIYKFFIVHSMTDHHLKISNKLRATKKSFNSVKAENSQCEGLNPYLGDFGNVREGHFWTKNPESLYRFWWRHTWLIFFSFIIILNYVSNANYTPPGKITWRHR